ncbi:4-methyl-5(b-hydroxyethyl)-thiazole monophosphate biosynthesis [Butyrivibrio hungatei DSM 14810]|uniref:4-methyl-5(B-hydroxyethyl)-thiazole monophosphate biosynthesis n=1 Tax=Butyrivibrio hungatei DSM 14810 TaxID=1121132 RepID=A0A1M7RXM4_9FIRM|nr:DJ-1/PfpI family protein [Butyrivibrio hungatei]SHN50884.1 4-methyl-5(b-hydroxyethyl)-thiazole monophosphate biosynthesis [Butyrivibrio hungatei DSM 14810]
MKVLLFCCKGFEMMEFAPFYDVLGWAKSEYGYDVEVDTCGFTREVPSAFWNTEIKANKLISEVNASDYDALAIPGGDHLYGFFEEAYDERFLKLIRDFNDSKKNIASVCVGSLPIGKSGVLAGRKATTYHLSEGYRQKELAEFGVDVVNEPVVVDGNVVTSYCPQTAPDVAYTLLERLIGKEKTDTVRRGMGFIE